MKALLTEAIKCTEENRHLEVNLETAKWELADAEKELKWLKSAVSSSEKEYEQIQQDIDDVQIELENERWFSNLSGLEYILIPIIHCATCFSVITSFNYHFHNFNLTWEENDNLHRNSRKNLEEEVKELNNKIAEMSSETGEAAVQKLQDEIKFCKSVLQCLVCRDRPKEVKKLTCLFHIVQLLCVCVGICIHLVRFTD